MVCNLSLPTVLIWHSDSSTSPAPNPMLIYASSTMLSDFSWKCMEYKSMKNFTLSSKPNDFSTDLHMLLGSLASFAISAMLCWFTTAVEMIPYVQLALSLWKYFKWSSARKACSSQIINLCCTRKNGFHTPNKYLCPIKNQVNLPQMWRKAPAKLLHMCSHCTNCSHWNSYASFVQQQSGRARYHMHNEKKIIEKWWAKTTYRLGKDAVTFCWKGTADQQGDVDLQRRAIYRHQNKLEKASNLWKGHRELISKIKGFAS